MTDADTLPPNHIRDGNSPPDMWVQEAIYGHRFREEQKPFMLVLEALLVCLGRIRTGHAMFPGLPNDGSHEKVQSHLEIHGPLRFLAFWQIIDEDEPAPAGSSQERFEKMIAALEASYPRSEGTHRFSHLGARFGHDPDALRQAVNIIRGCEVDAGSSRRPTARFLNPQGPHLHLSELGNKLSSSPRDFLARGGEMIYLMLNRSTSRVSLEGAVKKIFFNETDPIDHIAKMLSPTENEHRTGTDIGYLPWAEMDTYNRLGEDWLAILNASSLPRSEVLAPLSSITALNLFRYFGEAGEKGFDTPLQPIPLDMSDGRLTDIRRLGRMMLTHHREGIRDVVVAYVDAELKRSAAWNNCFGNASHPDPAIRSNNGRIAIEEALKMSFKGDTGLVKTPEEWRETALGIIGKRQNNDPETILLPLGRAAGFVTSRQRVGSWFGASDRLLEALVLANVSSPMTIDDFAERLHDRYGLVIGPIEAKQRLSGMNINAASFRKNIKLFEERLAALGMAKRLSDDCAFVSNPFAYGEQA
ncbi:hypothetical protein ACOI1H_23300 [Loktanella sp. DJP18]|uniref:hypothetical protein n=1 Tax=Loktanella sp. DJP18 TaxID=3409788 RepID=UPI003BB5AB32